MNWKRQHIMQELKRNITLTRRYELDHIQWPKWSWDLLFYHIQIMLKPSYKLNQHARRIYLLLIRERKTNLWCQEEKNTNLQTKKALNATLQEQETEQNSHWSPVQYHQNWIVCNCWMRNVKKWKKKSKQKENTICVYLCS